MSLARSMMGYAYLEAHRLNHDHICTEHLLLGLLAMGDPLVMRLLSDEEVDPVRVREAVESCLIPGGTQAPAPAGELPFTPRAKQVLERAVEFATRSGRTTIGPDLLLLALLHDDNSVAGCVLGNLGLDLRATLERVLPASSQAH